MNQRFSSGSGPLRLGGLLLAIFLVAPSVPLFAQEEDEDFVPAEAEQAAEGSDFGAIDDLLAQDEEVLSNPGIYSYDPESRRDPFRSLIKRNKEENKDMERPEGVPGLLIDDVELEGIFVTEEGPVAQIKASNQGASLLIRPGDQLWDGDVVDVTLSEVVFKQSVSDPTALRPFREVVKKLNP